MENKVVDENMQDALHFGGSVAGQQAGATEGSGMPRAAGAIEDGKTAADYLKDRSFFKNCPSSGGHLVNLKQYRED